MVLVMSLYGATQTQTTWFQKYVSAKQERLILLDVKFQHHIVSRSMNFECFKRGVYDPHKAVTPRLKDKSFSH